MVSLPKFSIATKLYAIFALLATATLVLALVAVLSARRHAALTDEFEAAFQGSQNVERINSLIYAVVMESRGVYMSEDAPTRRKYAEGLLKFNDQITNIVNAWERTVVRPELAADFKAFAGRIRQFVEFRRELARLGTEVGQAAGREWGDNDANRTVRMALNKDLETLSAFYAAQSKEIYAKIDSGIDFTALLMSFLAAAAVLLAAVGALIIWRGVVHPLAEIARVTEQVAEGRAVPVPYGPRRDEIGALSRSISVFQHAMLHNAELNKQIVQESEARGRRQETVSAEMAAFAASIEQSIAELGAISDQVMESAMQLAEAADRAARRTEGATAASSEASSNVRDIASAADELAASVMEIDRQVAQSNAIAEKAVGEAERTNSAVQELGEAAKRIGDVVRLITDIAEQTNLLALNATIEAARAGEAGRGFAVVAGEVKALAGQTAKATEDISKQIADMQHATNRSIAAIGAIERTIRDIGTISGAIAAAVTEQGAATQEIARSVDVAAKRTRDTAEEVSRVGDATDNTRANVTTVRTVAEELGAVAHRIRDQVEGFSLKMKAV
jgi:methyl-accepting chemotaxis protein